MTTRVQKSFNYLYILSSIVILLPFVCNSQEIYKTAKAKFYEMPDGLGTPSGACGYGEYGRNVYNGNVAAVSSRSLYRSGAGCGACFQVICKVPECNESGVSVLLTDNATNDNATTDDAEFILSFHAFVAMASLGKEKVLKDYGVVDIMYERIPCEYGVGENLRVKVLDYSTSPYYLAFVFLYQGGISSITAVEIFEEEEVKWKACKRSFGAVWEILNPPKIEESLTIRMFLPGAPRWVILPKAIPSSWKPGATY